MNKLVKQIEASVQQHLKPRKLKIKHNMSTVIESESTITVYYNFPGTLDEQFYNRLIHNNIIDTVMKEIAKREWGDSTVFIAENLNHYEVDIFQFNSRKTAINSARMKLPFKQNDNPMPYQSKPTTQHEQLLDNLIANVLHQFPQMTVKELLKVKPRWFWVRFNKFYLSICLSHIDEIVYNPITQQTVLGLIRDCLTLYEPESIVVDMYTVNTKTVFECNYSFTDGRKTGQLSEEIYLINILESL